MSEPKTKGELMRNIPGGYNQSKLIGRSTVKICYPDGTELIKYHNTIVVKKNPDGTIELNSGGFRTQTTKERINEYVGGRLWQENGIWYIYGQMFYDGIVVKDGKVVSEERKPDLKHINSMKRKISKYVKLIRDGNIPIPNDGDCWLCRMVDAKTGEPYESTDHLLSHLDEGYVVGSLLTNAMREYGYTDGQIWWHYKGHITTFFANAVRRYLTKRLLPGVAAK